RAADHCADRQGNEGRPGKMHRGGRIGLHRQTGQHRPAAGDAQAVVAPLVKRALEKAMEHTGIKTGPVSVLLVDDNPARLLSYRTILEPLGENLVEANSGMNALR